MVSRIGSCPDQTQRRIVSQKKDGVCPKRETPRLTFAVSEPRGFRVLPSS